MTYEPLTGNAFADQLLSPIPTDLVFSLMQSGWSPDQLMIMCLDRINHLQNRPQTRLGISAQIENKQQFARVVRLLIQLSERGAIETRHGSGKREEERTLVFDTNADTATQELIDEMKSLLDVNPARAEYRLIAGRGIRTRDEITIGWRSLLTLMGFLSRGVQIPASHLADSLVESNAQTATDLSEPLVPMRIASQSDRPTNAYVAVPFHDYWFYIPHSDHESKRAFSMLTYLFQLQAPESTMPGPLLTVPTG